MCEEVSCSRTLTVLHAAGICRKEIVVFKDGYRSRSYCLSECTQVCALTINPPAKPATTAAAGK